MCRARQFKLSAGVRSQGLIGYGILVSSLPSNVTRGRVAELADALDLGSSVAIRGGSSPLSPTTLEMPPERAVFFLPAPRRYNRSMSIIQTSQLPIHLHARPRKYAFLLDPSKRSISEIDSLTMFCLNQWGGRGSVIAPIVGRALAPDWIKLIVAADPDVIVSFDEIDIATAEILLSAIKPISFQIKKEHQKISFTESSLNYSSIDFAGVDLKNLGQLIGSDRNWRQRLVRLITDDARMSPEISSFCLRNFGLLSKETFQSVGSGDFIDPDFSGDSGRLLGYLASLDMGSFTLPNRLTYYYCGQEVADTEVVTFEGGLHVVVGNTFAEILYNWNRGLLKLPVSQNPTILLNEEQAASEVFREHLSEWIKHQVFVRPPQVNKIVSYSATFKSLETLCDYLTAATDLSFECKSLESNTFPLEGEQKATFHHWNRQEIVHGSDFSNQLGTTLTAPRPPGGSRTAGDRCFWMVDLKLLPAYKQNNGYFPGDDGWRLPSRTGLSQKFALTPGFEQKITAAGFLSLPARTSGEHFSMRIPTAHEFFSAMLEKYTVKLGTEVAWIRALEPTLRMKTSSNGVLLQKVCDLFTGANECAQVLGNSAWLSIFKSFESLNFREALSTRIGTTNFAQTDHAAVVDKERTLDSLTRFYTSQREAPGSLSHKQIVDIWKKTVGKLKQANKLHFSEAFPDSDFDKFLENRILFQGSLIKCSHCERSFWLSIEELAQNCTCPGCRETFSVGRLKLTYRLNDLLRNALNLQGIAPVIETLNKLQNGTQNSFVFLPSQDLYRLDGSIISDLDIVVYKDREFIIGEVKSSKHGLMDALNEKTLEQIAILRPDVFVLSGPAADFDEELTTLISEFSERIASKDTRLQLVKQDWQSF